MVFHRVVRGAATSGGVVPSLSWVTFRQQIETLRELGDVVPLISLLDAPPAGRRPRFALTFDDDSITHHDVVLPILRELQLTGTFFLGGRSLHGLGPPWFEILDTLVLRGGVSSGRSPARGHGAERHGAVGGMHGRPRIAAEARGAPARRRRGSGVSSTDDTSRRWLKPG